MGRNEVHQIVTWAPGAGGAILLGLATLGGEAVRAQIWATITAAVQEPVGIAAIVAVIILYPVLWFATRAKQKPEAVGEQFSQTHSGSGDNNMNF